MSANELTPHLQAVATAILERRIVPFLGAGANLCGKGNCTWSADQAENLPGGSDLADYLAEYCDYPTTEQKDLARVAQYAALMHGIDPLYSKLHEVFDKDYPPTRLHHFLASLPAFFRDRSIQEKNPVRQQLVIVTTNYDDVLERAFELAGEPYHKLVYMADEMEDEVVVSRQGIFLHWKPGEHEPRPIRDASKYGFVEEHDRATNTEKHPVIIKIHGTVDRIPSPDPNDSDPKNASYVITEDHYIDYLSSVNIIGLLPMSIVAILKKNNFLFLGYSLRDWNLRVFLKRLWRLGVAGKFTSWSIQRNATQMDRLYWGRRGVQIINMELDAYIKELEQHLAARGQARA